MKTECNTAKIEFQKHNTREVVGRFDGGAISSDAGGLLLREIERAAGVIAQASKCFTDYRNPEMIEHTVKELVAQRVFALAHGHEDLNDHDTLRHDPLLATLVGKADPMGLDRKRDADKGKPLAGAATLNRLELTADNVAEGERYKKIRLDMQKADLLLTNLFLQKPGPEPDTLILDLDATDDPLHGDQEGKFFHGYYRCYCYLPLYITCGESLLWAQLRPSNIDASAGSIEALGKIVPQIRDKWPDIRIVIRADSGFCREEIMAWCEKPANNVDYVLGLAKNERLKRKNHKAMKKARRLYLRTSAPARRYIHFKYSTLKTWSRSRRVIAKAEYIPGKENHRFVVTSLSSAEATPQALYEDWYCARGDMENRIKEQQLDLFADRTSTHLMRSNQIRLWFSSLAYTLIQLLREFALSGTPMAHAQCGTIREKLFKIGARIKISVRKIWIHFSESYPHQSLFSKIATKLKLLPDLAA